MRYLLALTLAATVSPLTWTISDSEWDQSFVVQSPRPTLTFTMGKLPKGSPTDYKMLCEADNSVCRLTLINQGFASGAAPDGYTEFAVSAQDEPRDASGSVISSSDVRGGVRVQSSAFNGGHCDDGGHCPNTAEFFSYGAMAFQTYSRSQIVYFHVGGRTALLMDERGVSLPQLKASAGRRTPICVDDQGTIGLC